MIAGRLKIAEKRKYGEILGRAGISEKIIELAKDIVKQDSYKNAIEKAGQIKVLVEAASFDCYWDEKAFKGIVKEEYEVIRKIKG